MLKRGIGIGLLCVAGHAYSDSISVTTTADEVKDDQYCSLREAVEYVKRGFANTDQEKPVEPYFGCSGITSAAPTLPIIYLKAKEKYVLTDELVLNHSVHIQSALSEDESGTTDSEERAAEAAIITTNGNRRLFTIARASTGENSKRIAAYFSYLKLQGNVNSTGIEQGGLIFNREQLVLNYVTLKDGRATRGGAIYNAGTLVENKYDQAGLVQINTSLVEGNKAAFGAVLFTEQALYDLKDSVFRNNEVTDASGAIIYTQLSFSDETLSQTGFTRNAWIYNSTLYNNTGTLVNVRDGVYINNVTALRNSKGIYFEAPKGHANVSNSILTENGSTDCEFSAGDKTILQKNLVTSLTQCTTGTTSDPNVALGTEKLIAGTNVEGQCDLPPSDGLLCPYRVPEKKLLGYFKPRLLMKYNSISESPIVNRGRIKSDGSSSSTFGCERTDQRGKARLSTELCDIGAIELVLDTSERTLVGQDIYFGGKAEMNIIDALGDSELVPANACPTLIGTQLDPAGQPWRVGCVRESRGEFFKEAKGTITLNEKGELTYTPVSNWHGSDEVDLLLMTTVTRFSESINERDLVIPVRIVQFPHNDFKDKTVNISGGSLGWLSLVALSALFVRRRQHKGAK